MTDEQTPEYLEALGRAVATVIPMCFPDWPCGRLKCKRCRRYSEEAWDNAEREFENLIWGFDA